MAPEGLLGISSDGDDWMEPRVKTQKKPKGLQQNPKNSLTFQRCNRRATWWSKRSLPYWGRNKCSSELHISNPQVTSKRNQKFTEAKGTSSGCEANWLKWSGWSLVHGRAPRDNADYCITRAMSSDTIVNYQTTAKHVCLYFKFELSSQSTTYSL